MRAYCHYRESHDYAISLIGLSRKLARFMPEALGVLYLGLRHGRTKFDYSRNSRYTRCSRREDLVAALLKLQVWEAQISRHKICAIYGIDIPLRYQPGIIG